MIPHAAACTCRECLEPLARIGRLYMRKESLPHSDPCPTQYEMAEQVLAALAGERG